VTDSDRRRLPGWVPVALVGVVAVIALTVVALSGPEFDPDTPEGTAQGWVRSVTAGDHAEALTHLDPSLGCTLSDFRYAWIDPGVAARIGSVSGDAQRTVVEVIISESDPFRSGFETREYLVMAQRGDLWLLTEVPWPLYTCEMEVEG
jgi:hypothetical protein